MPKARIMLVEDEKVVAADIQECVKGLGYEVVASAATGTEALRLAVNTSPDLVLMDIKLKGVLDGIDVAGALYDQLKIPVVYLTAHADAEILERAKLTAPSGYVLKPFDDRTLRTAIEIAFDRHRRERQLIEGGQRMAAAIGSIDEGVIITQENGRVALMNRVAELLTGWRQGDAIGKPVDEVFVLLNGRTGAPQASPIARVLHEDVAVGLGEEVLLLGRRGTRELIHGSATPVRDNAAQVGVCLLFRTSGFRSADEPWGASNHGSASRVQILGRLTAAVAHRFAKLLEAGRGRSHAAQLANRLLEFGQRQPSPAARLDLNDLVAGLDDLLECALGEEVSLQLLLPHAACWVKADLGAIELILMHLALNARDDNFPGEFTVETASAASAETGDGYAVMTVTPPVPGRDLPDLDEIIRQSPGEIRFSAESGAIKVYFPLEGGAAAS